MSDQALSLVELREWSLIMGGEGYKTGGGGGSSEVLPFTKRWGRKGFSHAEGVISDTCMVVSHHSWAAEGWCQLVTSTNFSSLQQPVMNVLFRSS